LEKTIRNYNFKNIVFASLLLGFFMWAHVVIAIVACIYLAVVVLICLLKRKYDMFALFSVSGIFGLILGSPFIWGLYVFVKSQISSSIGMRPLFLVNVLALFIAIFCLWYLLRNKQKVSLVPSTMAVLLTAVVVADCVLVRLFGTSYILDWLHAYRLQIFSYPFLIIAVLQAAQSRFEAVINDNKKLINCVGLVFLLIAAAINSPIFFHYADVSVEKNTNVDGRFLEIFRRSESYPSPYTFQTKLLNHDTDSSWAYGLFIESSPNSSFVKSLAKSFRPSAYQDEKDKSAIEDTIIDKSNIPFMLDLFAINNIISLDYNAKNAIGTWRRDGEVKYFHQEVLEPKQLVAINSFKLQPAKSNWDEAVASWWQQDGQINGLLYDASDGNIMKTDDSKSSVKVLKWSDQNIIFEINSKNISTVLIKTTFSKRWSAENSSNENVKIWKVSPYLMMVQSKGTISLSYK
jgi:hypothetical protein